MTLEFPEVRELATVPATIVAEGRGYSGTDQAAVILNSLPSQFGGPAHTSLEVISAGRKPHQPGATLNVVHARKPGGHDFN